jgi:Large polyvalent protein associated domain 29
MSDYLSCAETAKLVRAALKKAFPGVKFSVRSSVYAGGASIRVGWTDGPARKAVEAVAKGYAGGGFDGMIDMKYNVDSWLLPDGSVFAASSPGTSGSMGVYAPYNHAAPSPDAKRVRFGADFVFCDKEHSVESYRKALASVVAEYGIENAPELNTSGRGPYIPWNFPVSNAGLGGTDLATLVHRELSKESA